MSDHRFVICIRNRGYEASLELRKLYETLCDPDAETHGQIRVIDESGEDDLYPGDFFTPVELSRHVVERISHAV